MADATTTVLGNLTRDPELRYTPSGQANLALGVAVNQRWQNSTTKEWEERVHFFNMVAWGELAEHAAESLHKGDRVIVSGQLQYRAWETDEGDKRSVVEIRVDDIAPSLRWATAAVTRIKKEGGGQAREQGDYGAPTGGGAARPATAEAQYDDEEPF